MGLVLATTTIESEGKIDDAGELVAVVVVVVFLLVAAVVAVVLSRKGYFGDGSDAD